MLLPWGGRAGWAGVGDLPLGWDGSLEEWGMVVWVGYSGCTVLQPRTDGGPGGLAAQRPPATRDC